MRSHVTTLNVIWLIMLVWTINRAVMEPIYTSDSNGESNEDAILPATDLMLMNLLQPTVNKDFTYPTSASPVSDWIDSNNSLWLFLMKDQQGRKKRQNTNHHFQHTSLRRGSGSLGGAQLSISASIDALRSRLLREMARRENERQIEVNSKILTETGKRRKRDIDNTSPRIRSGDSESQDKERTSGIIAP